MGLLMGISGIGSVIGSIALISIPHGRRALVLKCAATAVALALAGLGGARSFAVAGGSLVLLTLGLSTSFGIANIVIQERAPDYLRGRVSSVAGLSFFGILPFSGLMVSGMVDLIGMRRTLFVCAAAFAVSAALLLARREQLASAPASSPKSAAEV